MLDSWKCMFRVGKTLLFEVLEGIMAVLVPNIFQLANVCQLFAAKWAHGRTKVIQSGADVAQLCSQGDLEWRLFGVKGHTRCRSAAWLGPAEGGEASLSDLCIGSLCIVASIQHALLPLTRCGGFKGLRPCRRPQEFQSILDFSSKFEFWKSSARLLLRRSLWDRTA